MLLPCLTRACTNLILTAHATCSLLLACSDLDHSYIRGDSVASMALLLAATFAVLFSVASALPPVRERF